MGKPRNFRYVLTGAFGAALWGLSGFTVNERLGQEPTPVLTPAQELATFRLDPGLRMQLVAAEPLVQDPVVTTFDEDGRLWVVEMRGYMNTIDAKGENEPTGRVSILEDRNGDGQMDVSTVYLDSLIMPRAIAVVRGGALIAENGALWLTQDLNNDHKADTKTLIDRDYAGGALPEHAGNGLWRGADNWYYNAKSRFRYRQTNGRWERDSTEFRGQWGISHDDKGRLFYNYNWSQLHADLVPPNSLNRNRHHTAATGIDHGLTIDRRIYPIRPNTAINRGYIAGTLDEQGRLLEFTAACSPLVYRGTALPKPYRGNAFVCEPAGNLIKRNVVSENGPVLSAVDPQPGTEFLASTDERFRPVSMATGPDEALYITDMYRGVIQHGAYMTPYLKEQTIGRAMLMPIHRGRIWRIVPADGKVSSGAKLSARTPADLVAYLGNPDGWHRDVAQRLLVEAQYKTVAPALRAMAVSGNNSLARFHALWTLDGLSLSDPALLLPLVSDADPLVQTTALRLLEPFARRNPAVRTQLETRLLAGWNRAPLESVVQMTLTADALGSAAAFRLLTGVAERYGAMPLVRDAILSSLEDREFAFLQTLQRALRWQTADPAREILLEMLTTAVVRKRDPAELTALLTTLDKPGAMPPWQAKVVLTGLAMGASVVKPVSLSAAPALLTQPNARIDEGRRQAVAALFEWPGHAAVRAGVGQKSLLNEEEQKLFAQGRQHYLATCSGCHGTDGAGLNRFAPPLINSDWVLGDEKRLSLIVLHGMEGPVEVAGKTYNAPTILPVMPAHSTMDDAVITTILMYIRNEWGNQAGPIGKRTVATTRVLSQGRVKPWTAKELNTYVLADKATSGK